MFSVPCYAVEGIPSPLQRFGIDLTSIPLAVVRVRTSDYHSMLLRFPSSTRLALSPYHHPQALHRSENIRHTPDLPLHTTTPRHLTFEDNHAPRLLGFHQRLQSVPNVSVMQCNEKDNLISKEKCRRFARSGRDVIVSSAFCELLPAFSLRSITLRVGFRVEQVDTIRLKSLELFPQDTEASDVSLRFPCDDRGHEKPPVKKIPLKNLVERGKKHPL